MRQTVASAQLLSLAVLSPAKELPASFGPEAGSAPDPVQRRSRSEKSQKILVYSPIRQPVALLSELSRLILRYYMRETFKHKSMGFRTKFVTGNQIIRSAFVILLCSSRHMARQQHFKHDVYLDNTLKHLVTTSKRKASPMQRSTRAYVIIAVYSENDRKPINTVLWEKIRVTTVDR